MKNILRWLFWPAYRALWAYMARSGFILFGGGKGDSPPAPDYGPMANASKESAQIAAALGRDQLAENRRQYDQNMAVAAPIIQAQTGIMQQAQQQGDDYYKYMTDTFRPIEQGLADEAQSGANRYNTNANLRASVEEEATRAAADVARATANASEQNNRAAAMMGVNPNSGRFASMKVGEKLAAAGLGASAQTQARTKGVALDYAKRMDVTGLGRNLPGASQGAYQIATGAGSSAVSNQNQTAAQYINGMSAGNGTIMQGQGMQMQGLGGILNSQTSMYNAAQQQGSDFLGSIGGIMGGGAALYTAFSDRRLKADIVKVGDDPRGFGVYEFCYATDPSRRYRGVMADEVQQVDPQAVIQGPDGYALVDYGRLGIQFTEV